jgi:hypothetical protein
MEFIKKKDDTYLLVTLDKSDTKYLKDFKKHEHRRHVKDTDKLFSHLFALHVQAVYVMTYCDMLLHDGIVTKKFMNKVTSELESLTRQYAKAIRKYMDRIYTLDMKHRKEIKKSTAAIKPRTKKKRKTRRKR